MARLSIVLIVGFALVCVFAKEELYSDRFDDVDVKNIFTNEKLRQQYYRCIISTAPCTTAPQRFFKEIFTDAIHTQCRRCTEKQKENLEFVIEWFIQNSPAEWEKIISKQLEKAQKV